MVASLALALSVDVARADSLDNVRSTGQLRWGADKAGGAPYVFNDPADPDKLIGFEAEIAEALAAELSKSLGTPIEAVHQQGDWELLPLLLEKGSMDLVLNGYELTPQRKERYLCSRGYYSYGLQLLVRRDSPIHSWADLAPRKDGKRYRVGVLLPSAAETYLKVHPAIGVEVVPYNGNIEAMRQVQDGVLDATLQDDCIAQHYADQFPDLRFVERPVSPGSHVAPGYYVMLLPKGEERLAQAVDDALGKIIADGRLEKIYDHWRLAGRAQTLALLNVSEIAPAPRATLGELLSAHLVTLLKAAGMTIFLACVSMPLAIALGILVALGRMYGPRPLAWLLAVYVEVLRGTPLMMQLYAIFFLLPKIGLTVPALVAAIAGLAINYSAYESEIYRAGLQAIPRGQMEAALALGMTKAQALWRIVLPQAVRIVIPPVTSDFIALFKDTSVCSVVTVMELTKQYSVLALGTGGVIEMAALTALLYLAMSYPLSLAAAWNERRLAGTAT
jgi:polar amino acid transport system substrate-binding protein